MNTTDRGNVGSSSNDNGLFNRKGAMMMMTQGTGGQNGYNGNDQQQQQQQGLFSKVQSNNTQTPNQ